MSGWTPPIRRGKKKRKKKRPLLRFGRVLPRTPQVWIEETAAPHIVLADRPRVVVSVDGPFETGHFPYRREGGRC